MNRSARQKVDLAADAVDHGSDLSKSPYHAALSGSGPRIRDLVDIDELVRRFLAGEMIKELAVEFAISESSIKRLLRTHGVRRRA